ncbi:hypothetical protein [Micromonospora sp. NPDC048830]|uniref:hypothetical protein n=1 Tax=Micromonospora sp. NPDC048830 TaxID=3364257 RepID=UPI0037141126
MALAAEGWSVRVERLPDSARSDLLANLIVTGQVPASADAVRLVRCVPQRRTDRRPVRDEEAPAGSVDAIVAAATAEGARLQVLTDDQVLELAAAAVTAAAVEAEDPQLRDELQYWTSRAAVRGAGLPAEVLPERAAQTTVPARDFGRAGTLPIGPGHDRGAVYALLAVR